MKDGQKLPQLHTIAYPEKYLPKLHEDGASAFSGKMDHANSRYYVFNDYYNIKAMIRCIFSLILKPISRPRSSPAARPAP